MAAEPPQKRSKVEDELFDRIKCPICLNIMMDNIYQCPVGHLFCDVCIDKNKQCHSCRVDLPKDKIRAGIMEQMREHMSIHCENKECKEITIGKEHFKRHFISCKYNRCDNVGCDFTGTIEEKQDHAYYCKFRKITCIACELKLSVPVMAAPNIYGGFQFEQPAREPVPFTFGRSAESSGLFGSHAPILPNIHTGLEEIQRHIVDRHSFVIEKISLDKPIIISDLMIRENGTTFNFYCLDNGDILYSKITKENGHYEPAYSIELKSISVNKYRCVYSICGGSDTNCVSLKHTCDILPYGYVCNDKSHTFEVFHPLHKFITQDNKISVTLSISRK